MDEKQGFRIVKIASDAGRDRYAAMRGGDEVGSVLMNWQPKYKFFAHENIPEIQDLFVEEHARRQGVGRALVEYCEDLVREAGQTRVGIGVGLTADYGAAQRLYVRMGYVPDGHGVTHDRVTLRAGEFRAVDDDMSLMLVKRL